MPHAAPRPRRSPSRIGRLFQSLQQALFDPYAPEKHYMRGPGPRCRQKQLEAAMASGRAG